MIFFLWNRRIFFFHTTEINELQCCLDTSVLQNMFLCVLQKKEKVIMIIGGGQSLYHSLSVLLVWVFPVTRWGRWLTAWGLESVWPLGVCLSHFTSSVCSCVTHELFTHTQIKTPEINKPLLCCTGFCCVLFEVHHPASTHYVWAFSSLLFSRFQSCFGSLRTSHASLLSLNLFFKPVLL